MFELFVKPNTILLPSDWFNCTHQADCLKSAWVFDAGVSICWVFLLLCTVGLGCIWDIDEKGWGQNVAFSHLKALSVSLGFQSVLSAERKMVV